MGLFSKMTEPVFLKEDSSAKEQLAQLEALLPQASGKVKTKIEQDIRSLQYGIYGEDKILFELKNSHFPMYVLHDLFLQGEEQCAQIDFYIITPKINFVIECKNLYGDIEITQEGNFIRTVRFGRKESREGIYSPITQNERHLELIRTICGKRFGAIRRTMYDKLFYRFHKSLIVLANPKTILDDSQAPPEIRSQVIRADQLIRSIKTANAQSKEPASSERDMESAARRILGQHQENPVNYTEKYGLSPDPVLAESAPAEAPARRQAQKPPQVKPVESTCPHCGAKLVKRKGRYGLFWGCSNYPSCSYTQKIVAQRNP